jgi:precorrin-2 dehydrogenase / sirohydrochlorin ferrochelatase
MPGYAIELDLTGRTALVVGLGAVGQRRARGLLAAGARVVAVDPAPPFDVLEGIVLRAEPYRPQHLHGVSLAFAAATSEVNRHVVSDARAAGIWVSSASDPGEGDFHVPAVWREGGVTLAVSTAGASPALAGALRDRAAGALGPTAAGLATALSGLRPEVVARLPDPEMRRRVLADWGDPRWLALFAEGGVGAVRTEVWRRLDAVASAGLPEKTP